MIDDVLLFNRPLAESEIAQLLHEGDWTPPMVADVAMARDPLSGRWGCDGVAFLDLRFDGEQTIAGEVMHGTPRQMVPIAAGTFRRAAAALSLAGMAPDRRTGELVPYTIVGELHSGELAVVARVGDFAGNFVFTRRGSWPRLTRRSLRSLWGSLAFRWRQR